MGDELSLHPLKLENVSESPSETPLSPVSETFWLSPTTEEKEFSSVSQIKGKKFPEAWTKNHWYLLYALDRKNGIQMFIPIWPLF